MIWRKPNPETVLRAAHAALAGRIAPETIDSLVIEDGVAILTLWSTREAAASLEAQSAPLVDALQAVAGIETVKLVLTAAREGAGTGPAQGAGAHGGASRSADPAAAKGPAFGHGVAGKRITLPEVRRVVAVASGKGGVGKSTSAVNLALALARAGQRVGLLDADIHGPSLPTMLGVTEKPAVVAGRIQPVEAFGLRSISMGYLVEADKAMIWRGPMVMGAIQQLLGQVDWGTLDLLLVDLPPGTGDAQLTLAQSVRLDGAVIVSTPQDVALADARRAASMFTRLGVPVLGVIENMSYYCCPECGARSDLFGHGGARLEAARLQVAFLGEVPLLRAVRQAADRGEPIMHADPDGEAGRAYQAIAAALLARLTVASPASN